MTEQEWLCINREIANLYGFGGIIAQFPPTPKPLTQLELMQYEAEMIGAD